MNLWHICADSEASFAASMAAARLSAVLVLQPSTDSWADATACMRNTSRQQQSLTAATSEVRKDMQQRALRSSPEALASP